MTLPAGEIPDILGDSKPARAGEAARMSESDERGAKVTELRVSRTGPDKRGFPADFMGILAQNGVRK